LRFSSEVPVLPFALLALTRFDAVAPAKIFGIVASNPNRFGRPMLSLLLRVAVVLSFRSAASVMFTSTVTISPTWAAR
jgi:hypothetical protein